MYGDWITEATCDTCETVREGSAAYDASLGAPYVNFQCGTCGEETTGYEHND